MPVSTAVSRGRGILPTRRWRMLRSRATICTRGTLERGVRFALEFCANAIERVGDGVGCMPRDELSQGFGVQLTARNLEPLRKMLDLVKDFIRNGDGRLHTKSITVKSR
jgi:hypothetical protein